MGHLPGFLLKLFSLLDWFLPRGLVRKASVDRIRARIFVAVAFFPVLGSLLHYLVLGRSLFSEQSSWFLVAQILLAATALIFIRLTGHFRRGAFLYLSAVQVLACLAIVMSQSIHSVYYTWLPVRIIVAVLILEASSAIWLCLVYVLLTIATVHFNAVYGNALPPGQTLATFTQSNLFMMLMAEGLLVLISLLFENYRRRKQAAFLHERSKISESLGAYALGEMVGGVSHEVNNPLAIAMGLLIQYEKIAQNANGRTDFADMQQKLDRSLQRIRYVVEGLKTFSQGELDERIEEKTVRAICTQLLVLNQEGLNERKTCLRFTDWTGNMSFHCRPHQLVRTLQGLVINAIEATADAEKPDIELKIFRESSTLILQVIDNGRGIPIHLRHRIFEPFFSTKSFQAGQGLTLATSKGLIEAQGGQMNYQSLPHGSCFAIRLPLEPPSSLGDSHERHSVITRHQTVWQKLLGVFGNKSRSLYPAR